MSIVTLNDATDHIFPSPLTQYTRPIAPQSRRPNFQPHHDTPRNRKTNDPVRKVKLDAPEFDGLEFTVFLNWFDKIDKYFEWYNTFDAHHISMARIKLVGMQNIFESSCA